VADCWLARHRQGRRPLRSRPAKQDSENAVARPSTRTSSRAKPLSSNTASLSQNIVPSDKPVKAGSGIDKGDPAAGKRKREAFAEVTALANRGDADPNVRKGKEKEDPKKFDGVVINKTKVPQSRKPLRSVPSKPAKAAPSQPQVTTTTTARVLEVVTETVEVRDENAMVVDPPTQHTLPALAIRKSLVPEDQVPPSRRPQGTNRRSHPREDDDPEASRVHKKRRTSSEAPEEYHLSPRAREQLARDAIAAKIEAELAAMENEEEADPNGDQWEDLDAEDGEDPMMVSEYVGEVFEYFKEIEVGIRSCSTYLTLIHFLPRSKPCLIRTIWLIKQN
jgi:G2/mitotic-specific cyclin 2